MSEYSELAAYWRNEARHGDVAEAVGDDCTAEYAKQALATATAIEALMRKVEVASNAFRTINSATINTKAQCAVIARKALQKMEE